jgi:DnaJ-class molecular chaperone
MSTCPDCKGTGADAKKTQQARKTGLCDSRSYIRCWTCNGNGNDTYADFMALRNTEYTKC